MSESTPPLRRVTGLDGPNEILECGHRQLRKHNSAMRRRCQQCTELRRASVTVREKAQAAEGARCPFCFDDFTNNEEATWTCSNCHARLHDECHDENGSCTSLGCRNKAAIFVRPRPAPIETAQPTPVVEQATTSEDPDWQAVQDEADRLTPVPDYGEAIFALVIILLVILVPLITWAVIDTGAALLALAAIGWASSRTITEHNRRRGR